MRLTTKTAPFEGTAKELQIHHSTLLVMVMYGKAKIVGKDKKGRNIYHIFAEPDEP